ncbi:bifunctional diguanylate cyclase/phosphodiesterase [Alteromonas sediminis]|uniref:Sensor protein FixL n=1 Tax=Alteromonas sediminis TaxID=2259342 RepID=A0A3N5Y0X3_9ALTE|nr:bifunctional diguanylate cyclase/phosphodiesterase [Alteromonas sediminis]RPJ67387.1 bifunctional diguanylate cyclase/phosphodiesterase [Alteromonas sediminis]
MYKYKDSFGTEELSDIVADQKERQYSYMEKLKEEINAYSVCLQSIKQNGIFTLLTVGEADIDLPVMAEKVLHEGYYSEKDSKNTIYLGCAIKNGKGDNIGVLACYCPDLPNNSDLIHKLTTLYADKISIFVQKCFGEKRLESYLVLVDKIQAISKTGAWEYNFENGQVYWSEEIYRIHGLPSEHQLSPEQAINFYAENERPIITAAFNRVVSEGKSYDLELEFFDHAGNKKWIRTTGTPEFDSQGQVIRAYGAFEDITEQKLLTLSVEEKKAKIANIFDNINDAILTINSSGIITHCNQVANKMFGYADDELIGSNVCLLMPEPHASMHSGYIAHFEKTRQAKIIGIGRQLPAQRKNGEIFQMELSLTESIEDGKVQYIGTIRDISERIKAEDTIYNIAYTDSVTGLRNFRWFEVVCQELMNLAMREAKHIHLLLLDIDAMSTFNQKYGFKEGDRAMKQIAENIQNVIPLHYTIFRYQSDSFILLSDELYAPETLSDASFEDIKHTLLDPQNFYLDIKHNTVSLAASVGSAVCNPDQHSFESVLGVLEHARKVAKQDSPMGFFHIDDKAFAAYNRFIAINNLLSQPQKISGLSLHFQPQFNNDGHLFSCEALLRWNDKDMGFISPAEFIPLAEENNAIIEIGQWVIEESCAFIKQLQDKGFSLSVSINVSVKQILMPDFSSGFINTLEKQGIDPSRIVIEITETVLISNIAVVKETMSTLAERGIRFSIDDFGTGYSSLAYLKELPISEIKIDKYFIDDIQCNDESKSYAIVDAIINMSKALGAVCVAEGVESESQFHYLKRHGCSLYQGYYFSKPISMTHFVSFLEKRAQSTVNI